MCFHARARAAAKQLYVGHLGAVLRLNVASRRGDSATAVRRLALQRRLIRLRWPWTRPATKAAHEAPALSWPSVSERRRNSPTQLCERRAWLLRLKRPSRQIRAQLQVLVCGGGHGPDGLRKVASELARLPHLPVQGQGSCKTARRSMGPRQQDLVRARLDRSAAIRQVVGVEREPMRRTLRETERDMRDSRETEAREIEFSRSWAW